MTVAVDRFAGASSVGDAVLYEGYVLYPYRASSRKNQIRWQFGVLAPRPWADAEGSERWANRTEVLVDAGDAPILHVRLRCLQVQSRVVERMTADGTFEHVGNLAVADVTFVDFSEAVEHEIDLPAVPLLPLSGASVRHTFELPADASLEPIGDGVGRLVRSRSRVGGVAEVRTEWADGPGAVLKVVVSVTNTVADIDPEASRDQAMVRSLVAVHTLMALDDASFVSLLDPPDFAAHAVATCKSEGTYPVLVGEEGAQTAEVVLSSPIILYDHPAIAPESQGDMFDATEIDEILALRILTLTDDEKAEARGTDRRAAAIVDRCDDLPPEVWERLHGAVRSIGPSPLEAEAKPWWDPGTDGSVDPFADTTMIAGHQVGRGTKVMLRPSRRADAHDLFLAGQPATVAGVFHDVDGGEHLAVTLDDDPAAELFGETGRFYYFATDEVELT